MLNVGQVSKLKLSHDLLHICQRTYIHTYKVETTVLTFLETKQNKEHHAYMKRKQRGCRGGCWLLFQLSDINMALIYSSRSASMQEPVSRACHALGCGRAAWRHCRPRVHRYNTLHSLSGHRDCKVNGTGSSETNSREKRGTGWQVTDMNRRHRQEMGHAPCLFLSPRGSS